MVMISDRLIPRLTGGKGVTENSEAQNVEVSRLDEKPEGGQTIIARAKDTNAETLLQRIREVWKIVANWGTGIVDDNISEEQFLSQLPEWFKVQLTSNTALNILDLTLDRDWVWWSSTAIGNIVKIDLKMESFPNSTLPIRGVIEASGGDIVYEGKWITTTDAITIARS